MTSPSAYTSWFVGMRVCCVDDDWGGGRSPLCSGFVYTIFKIEWCDHRLSTIIDLVEVENPDIEVWAPLPGGFNPARFRPIHTRKTSIAIFERIRDNPKAPIVEPSPKQRERVS